MVGTQQEMAPAADEPTTAPRSNLSLLGMHIGRAQFSVHVQYTV